MEDNKKNDFQFVNRHEDIEIDRVYAANSYTTLKRFFRKKSNVFGLALLLLLVALAVAGPLISGYDYAEQNLEQADLAPMIPGIISGEENIYATTGKIKQNRYRELGIKKETHIFGTDSLGRDLFTRCFQGLRVSLMIALAAVLTDLFIGMNYGMISGLLGGKVDFVMQQIVDILASIPPLVIVTVMMLILKPGVGAIIIALVLTGWMEMSLMARAQVLRLKEQEFILAAKTLGASNFYILFKEILPNIGGTLITQIMVSIPNAIFLETFLSFVGLGIPVGGCSLGRLIADGFDNCLLHPYKLFPAMFILIALMVACNLVADGVKEAFDH